MDRRMLAKYELASMGGNEREKEKLSVRGTNR